MIHKILDFLRILLTGLNLYFFLGIVMNTAVTVSGLFLAVTVFYGLGYLLYRWIWKDWKRIFGWFDYFGILLPFIFNGFFFINYFFSSHQEIKTYTFTNIPTVISGSTGVYSSNQGDSTTIILDNGDYQNYYLFLTFPDYLAMRGKNRITLKTETGLFGLLVLKDYEFSGHK